MALFSKSYAAYFDCSGSPKDGRAKVLVVSGAVSTLDKWLKFSREWIAVLDKYGLPKPFHMAEFMNAWRGREVERDQIVGALAKVIRKRTNKMFQSGVVLVRPSGIGRSLSASHPRIGGSGRSAA